MTQDYSVLATLIANAAKQMEAGGIPAGNWAWAANVLNMAAQGVRDLEDFRTKAAMSEMRAEDAEERCKRAERKLKIAQREIAILTLVDAPRAAGIAGVSVKHWNKLSRDMKTPTPAREVGSSRLWRQSEIEEWAKGR